MASVLLGARIVLAGVFTVAGVAKLLDQPGSRRTLVGFGVPSAAIPALVPLLPAAELAIAAALIPAGSARWAAVASVLLLLCFVTAIAVAMRGGGQAPSCHCFGQLSSEPAGWATLGRNAFLGVLGAVVVIDGPGPEVGSWVSARTAAELAAVGIGAIAIALGVIVIRLWRERRDLSRDLAAAKQKLVGLPLGLPVGMTAPDFALPDLNGQIHTLTSLCARGRPVVLMFVSQGCGPCDDLWPEIGRWQRSLAHRVTLIVVTRGTVLENLPTAKRHGISMLRQESMEVMLAYKVRATPSALIVAPDRTVASHAVEATVAIEPLIRLAVRRESLAPDESGRAAIEPPAA